jgi:hypothetical protein
MSNDQLHADPCASASRSDGMVLSRPETGATDPHPFGTAASAETGRQDCPPVRPADRRTLRGGPCCSWRCLPQSQSGPDGSESAR